MRRILVDTSVYSLAMRGDEGAADLLRDAEELLICPMVVGELLAGFARGSHERANLRVLHEFMLSPRVRLVDISSDTAEFYARILNQLRRQGTPIPANDIWIAACVMEQGARLATTDAHFGHVHGLLCVAPES